MPLWRKLCSKLKIKESAKIHNEGLSGEICRFLVFFGTWHEASVVWISEISDQPFMSFHKQIHQKHPIFDQLVKKIFYAKFW